VDDAQSERLVCCDWTLNLTVVEGLSECEAETEKQSCQETGVVQETKMRV
jgi:hypothetical protein